MSDTPKHSPESWTLTKLGAIERGGDRQEVTADRFITPEDNKRTAQCVNALEGMENPEEEIAGLRDKLSRLKEAENLLCTHPACDNHIIHTVDSCLHNEGSLAQRLSAVEKERDQLKTRLARMSDYEKLLNLPQ